MQGIRGEVKLGYSESIGVSKGNGLNENWPKENLNNKEGNLNQVEGAISNNDDGPNKELANGSYELNGVGSEQNMHLGSERVDTQEDGKKKRNGTKKGLVGAERREAQERSLRKRMKIPIHVGTQKILSFCDLNSNMTGAS